MRDWVWLDALYRSRSLELPKSGESLVPCLDLVNHSHQHTAYFEENSKDEVVLLLRDGANVASGTEVTINYGESKSAAEMLFSYGFTDPDATRQGLSLPMKLMTDDPLLKAKLHAFGKAPTLEIREDENGIPDWSAPFVYLMCLNEEDGLDFRILQETDGSQQLKMFWQERDVTDTPNAFKELISGHELQHIFELRAITVIIEMVEEQLERLDVSGRSSDIPEVVRADTLRAAIQLRNIETALLRRALETLNNEVSQTSLLVLDSFLDQQRWLSEPRTNYYTPHRGQTYLQRTVCWLILKLLKLTRRMRIRMTRISADLNKYIPNIYLGRDSGPGP